MTNKKRVFLQTSAWVLIVAIFLVGCKQKTADPTPTPAATEATAVPAIGSSAKFDTEQLAETYAETVLGLIVHATEVTQVQGQQILPNLIEGDASRALNSANEIHYATWEKGLITIALNRIANKGNIPTAIQQDSIAIVTSSSTDILPTTAVAAIDVLHQSYPFLSEISLNPLTSGEAGYTFYYTPLSDDIPLGQSNITFRAEIVMLGLTPKNGSDGYTAWVMIASGALAEPFK